jgi:hypothetical protein
VEELKAMDQSATASELQKRKVCVYGWVGGGVGGCLGGVTGGGGVCSG